MLQSPFVRRGYWHAFWASVVRPWHASLLTTWRQELQHSKSHFRLLFVYYLPQLMTFMTCVRYLYPKFISDLCRSPSCIEWTSWAYTVEAMWNDMRWAYKTSLFLIGFSSWSHFQDQCYLSCSKLVSCITYVSSFDINFNVFTNKNLFIWVFSSDWSCPKENFISKLSIYWIRIMLSFG
jgi:hypothetical protein